MSELFAVFRQHLLWSLALFLVVFTGFAALFARGRLGALITGLVRLLVSIATSPFVFLQRATSGVVECDAEQEQSDREGDQYLLTKAMRILQAVIIIAATGALAASVVAIWNTLVPPSEVRKAARDYRERVEEQRIAATNAASAVAKLDAAWSAKEAEVVGRYRNERNTTIKNATRDLAYIESSVAQYGNENVKRVMGQLRDRAAQYNTITRDRLEYGKTAMDSIVYNHWYWLEEWSRNSLNRWSELWLTRATAEAELRELSVADLRNAEQPDYAAASEKNTREAETLQSMTEQQARLDEAASLKWKSAGWRALTALVTFLLFVWTAGLLVEAGWLAIRVAGDVRRLRESAETRPAQPAPPPPVPQVIESTQRDVVMPIREPVAARPVHP